MIIDTHCHIDLYDQPEGILKKCEYEGVRIIAMTNLPSHFEIGLPFFKQTKTSRIALGMHPLFADKHMIEFEIFLRNFDKTSYIGEIGLDFSREGMASKDIQIETFSRILKETQGQKKILSIHSRKAEKEILDHLVDNNINHAIFHWYTGPVSLIKNIVDAGYYFSINPQMIKSKSGKKIIDSIPITRILTESDGPFIVLEGKQIHPSDVVIVIKYLAGKLMQTEQEIEQLITNNFNKLISSIK